MAGSSGLQLNDQIAAGRHCVATNIISERPNLPELRDFGFPNGVALDQSECDATTNFSGRNFAGIRGRFTSKIRP